MEKEARVLEQSLAEVRAVVPNEGDGYRITGKGIVFNQRSELLGWFYEYIDADAIRDVDFSGTVAYFNHDPNFVLGSSDNRTLSLDITRDAVTYSIDAPTTNTIRDLVIAPIDRGDVRGSSFMFTVARNGDDWEEEQDGTIIRYVKKIERVYEMGPVSMPAYRQTTTDIAKRSFDQWIETVRTSEEAQTVDSMYRRELARRRLQIIKLKENY